MGNKAMSSETGSSQASAAHHDIDLIWGVGYIDLPVVQQPERANDGAQR